MLLGYLAFERLLEQWNLVALTPSGHVCHLQTVGLSFDESLDHVAARYAQNVRGYHSQLDVSIFQHPVDAVCHRRHLLSQFGPQSGQIPHFPLSPRWNETASQQPKLQ